jgi:hypothetical protein
MALPLYQIVFSGEVADGWDVDTVKKNLSTLFNADPKVIATLFSGRPVVIKQGIDQDAAMKYVAALASAGSVSRMQPMPAAETSTEQQTTEQRRDARRRRPSRRQNERLNSIQPDRRVNPDRRRKSGGQ